MSSDATDTLTSSTRHIELRLNRDGQPRAYVAGTRIRVQDVAVQAETFGKTPDEIVAAFPHLTLGQVHAALSYYFDHRDTMIEQMRQDDEFVSQLKSRTDPGPLQDKLSKQRDDGAPLPS